MTEKRTSKGNLFVISAPSGAGKTTLCKRLEDEMPGLRQSVSYTTRRPRKGEAEGRDYCFVSREEFMRMVGDGEFAEWAEVHGSLYGTSAKRLNRMLKEGTDAILDIDTQGARKIREAYKEGVFVFIMPPSMEALRERLGARMANTEEEIGLRMRRAADEIGDYKSYNYVIVNDSLEDALQKLKAVVRAVRAQASKIDPLWVEENFFKREKD